MGCRGLSRVAVDCVGCGLLGLYALVGRGGDVQGSDGFPPRYYRAPHLFSRCDGAFNARQQGEYGLDEVEAMSREQLLEEIRQVWALRLD